MGYSETDTRAKLIEPAIHARAHFDVPGNMLRETNERMFAA